MQAQFPLPTAYASIVHYLKSVDADATETIYCNTASRVRWIGKMSVTAQLMPGLSVVVSADPAIAEKYMAARGGDGGFYFDEEDGNVFEYAVEGCGDVDFVLAELKHLVGCL